MSPEHDEDDKDASSRSGGSSSHSKSSKLSANMSESTHRRLSDLQDKPGLSFYTAYAHVSDVNEHLSSFKQDDIDPYSYTTLLSCTLTSQELLLGLLYRYNVIDFRPGVDRKGIGLLVGEIVRSFSSLLQLAKNLGAENTTLHHNSSEQQRKTSEEHQSSSDCSVDSVSSIPSMLSAMSDATSLGLVCSSSKSALRSVVEFLDDQKAFFEMNDQEDASLSELSSVLGVTRSPAASSSASKNSVGLATYSQVACTLPNILKRSHRNGSPHGPEDYTFQIPHVILELFFWYTEHVLLPQAGFEGSETSSDVLILLCSIFEVCTKVMSILDLMLLADFHPLRVAVHGSSGFYSEAWHRIRAWFARAYRQTTKSMENLNQIHLCPEMYVEESLYLQRLDRASASFRAFSFRHYILAQRTIGSNSMGSAGKTFEHMQSSFLPHPDTKSNDAKYRVHEYTNIKYANFVGLGTEAVSGEAAQFASTEDSFAEDSSLDDIEDDVAKTYTAFPATKETFKALETCFVEADAEAFVNLFDTTNCCIEHPVGTLSYSGTDTKSYFLNMTKKHPVFHSFHGSSVDDGTKIIIDVDADLFNGARVQYKIQGECKIDNDGKILRLTLDGQPDINKELCENNDQRLFSWKTNPSQGYDESAALHARFRRSLAPAEVLAYELNTNKSGNKVSDGLTIVARSLVRCGEVLSNELIHSAVNQVARRNVLLTARIESTPEGYYFVSDDPNRPIQVQIVDSESRLDCAPHLNTQFKCHEGDMIRVIVTKLGPSSLELSTVMFHGICDAISVRDLHGQILKRLALLCEHSHSKSRMSILNETILPTPLPLPALHFAKKALSKRAAAEPLPLPDPAPIHVPQHEEDTKTDDKLSKSMYITRQLDTKTTETLVAACRNQTTTVHAAIGAASLLAAHCGDCQRRVLTSAVDLRRRLGMPKSELVYSVGGFDGSAAFEYDLSDYEHTPNEKKNSSFWKLCHSIRRDLVDTIDSGRLLTTYESCVGGLVQAYKGSFLDGGVFGTVFLSNIGSESYPKDFGNFQWLDFDYVYGQFLPGGPHYHITCSTFDGHLNLNFQYVSPTIPDSEANAFVDSTMALLMERVRDVIGYEHTVG